MILSSCGGFILFIDKTLRFKHRYGPQYFEMTDSPSYSAYPTYSRPPSLFQTIFATLGFLGKVGSYAPLRTSTVLSLPYHSLVPCIGCNSLELFKMLCSFMKCSQSTYLSYTSIHLSLEGFNLAFNFFAPHRS